MVWKTDLPGQHRNRSWQTARSGLSGANQAPGRHPWHFTLLTPLQDLRRESMVQGILVGVAFALLAILGIAWNERRKVIATRLAAREALEEANSQLERRIAERTADLRASNERLKGQIRERLRCRADLAPRPG